MSHHTRRSFLVSSALTAGAGWLASNWAEILQARAYADDASETRSRKFAFFTDEQAAEINAVASQIIPTDDTPGAHEAGCVYFIDCALTTFLQDQQPLYIEGLESLQSKTKEVVPEASHFASLSPDQQVQVLKAMEDTPFFAAVRLHTITGMFASPAHAGNCEKIGWKLIGYEDTLNFTPPFGYYDAEVEPW